MRPAGLDGWLFFSAGSGALQPEEPAVTLKVHLEDPKNPKAEAEAELQQPVFPAEGNLKVRLSPGDEASSFPFKSYLLNPFFPLCISLIAVAEEPSKNSWRNTK